MVEGDGAEAEATRRDGKSKEDEGTGAGSTKKRTECMPRAKLV